MLEAIIQFLAQSKELGSVSHAALSERHLWLYLERSSNILKENRAVRRKVKVKKGAERTSF